MCYLIIVQLWPTADVHVILLINSFNSVSNLDHIESQRNYCRSDIQRQFGGNTTGIKMVLILPEI